jgi:flagellar motor switch protein FliN/FliY
MSKYIASWLAAAAEVLGAELASPVDLLPGAAIPASAGTFSLMVDIAGEWCGTFTVTAGKSALGDLFGEANAAANPSAAEAQEAVEERWQAIFSRICLKAAADLGAASGRSCEVAMISSEPGPVAASAMGYQLRSGERMTALLVADEVLATEAAASRVAPPPSSAVDAEPGGAMPPTGEAASGSSQARPPASAPSSPAAMRGVELLLDIELEASLRFGSREMALSDLLALGPGDVVQLDRSLTDPVDLLIGNKIVARGEVVLVNGNFGLQVTEVAEPRKTLESIRCLF